MTTSENIAIVRPISGEPTTFDVASKSHPDQWHRVCIKAHDGAGECACIRWATVCWPLIRDTGKLPPAKRCRHIKAAREYFCSKAIAAIPSYE